MKGILVFKEVPESCLSCLALSSNYIGEFRCGASQVTDVDWDGFLDPYKDVIYQRPESCPLTIISEYNEDTWIDVDESLPQPYTEVLIFANKIVGVGMIDDTGCWTDFRNVSRPNDGQVTYWKPLPELPKE